MFNIMLLDGDSALFMPLFGQAIVIVRPGKITASGKATLKGKKIALVGDEKTVSVIGCVYMTPIYSIPGTGTLKIATIAGNQKTQKSTCQGNAFLLKGQQFTAKFEVQNPAKQPPPGPGAPIPDPTPTYQGVGLFLNSHIQMQAK
ncbi:MAG: hypothetical protein HamCj_00760 [Candidatus Hamiltonella defensa (Ceratovacuna japonica)]